MSHVRAHLTVVETIYHQAGNDEQPTAVPHTYMRALTSEEQAYSRVMSVGEDWMPLDSGWLQKCSQVWIHNQQLRRDANPTQDEREADSGRIVDVGIKLPSTEPRDNWSPPDGHPVPTLWLHPNDSMRAPFTDPAMVYLRCRNGVAKVRVVVFPE